MTQNMDTLTKIIEEYEESIKPFMNIYNLARDCKSLKNLLEEEFALPEEGELTISQKIQFINCFSDKVYFAECVYTELEKQQRGKGTPITESELKLIQAVNEYYRSVFTIDWDILDCMGIGKGTDFHKEIMKDAKNPMNSYLSFVDYLCIPAIRGLDGRIKEKAYIVGR